MNVADEMAYYAETVLLVTILPTPPTPTPASLPSKETYKHVYVESFTILYENDPRGRGGEGGSLISVPSSCRF